MRRPSIVLASLATAASILLVAGPASADLFECIGDGGRRWITNYKEPGHKCHVVMKTAGPSAVPGHSQDVDSSGKPGQSKAFKPRRGDEVPRAVREPESLKERLDLYQPYIEEASTRYRIPTQFIQAVMRVESSFRYKAVSEAGAQGLMQLMPKTARSMGVNDSFDPRQNIMGGARLLRVLANRFEGDMVKVLSAYHAGSGAVAKKGGIPYEATEGYVRAVLDHYYRYRANG